MRNLAQVPGEDELARVQRQLADLEQLADVGYWDFDIAAGVAMWSDGLCRAYGVPSGAEVTYDEWLAMVHPDDRAVIQPIIEAAVERCGEYGFEHRFHRVSDGAVRWTRCRGRVVAGPDGKAARIFGVSVDTTAEHDAAAARTEFLANAAHELRTPTAAISQAVHALELVEGDDRQQVLEILLRQTNRLRTLTANLVDLAIVEAGPSVELLESVELAPAVAEAAVNAPAPEGRSLDLSGVPAGLVARADRAALDRILVNLLTNAWRYGGPHVTVTAAADGDAAAVELRVADDGVGVPEAARPTLFQPFRRGPQRHPEASGLGLAIVDRLVRRMGGTIRYVEGDDGGAVFVVSLDAA